jgi:F0F1-type ATP synthase membrane subunit c/vacuolar-type H+-ATPase subunit K
MVFLGEAAFYTAHKLGSYWWWFLILVALMGAAGVEAILVGRWAFAIVRQPAQGPSARIRAAGIFLAVGAAEAFVALLVSIAAIFSLSL